MFHFCLYWNTCLLLTKNRDALAHVTNQVVDIGAEAVSAAGARTEDLQWLRNHHNPRMISMKLLFLEWLQDQNLAKLIMDFTRYDLSVIWEHRLLIFMSRQKFWNSEKRRTYDAGIGTSSVICGMYWSLLLKSFYFPKHHILEWEEQKWLHHYLSANWSH